MSAAVFDPFTNTNSVTLVLRPGLGMTRTSDFLNVAVDPLSLYINASNKIAVKTGGIKNSHLENSSLSIVPSSGITISSQQISLGQSVNLDLQLDNASLYINPSDKIAIKPSGVLNTHLLNQGFGVTSGQGIILNTSFVNLGQTLNIQLDNTIITSGALNSIMSGNLTLGNYEESYSPITGSLKVRGGAGVTGNINSGGEITATAFNANSDKRLKKNIKKISGSLEKIKQIECVSYKWKNPKNPKNKKKVYGVIAQQIEKIGLGDLVNNENKYKSVNYIQLIPLLIQSIQELSEKIK